MNTTQLPVSGMVRPPVLKWFRGYCRVLCVMYLAVAAFSLVFLLVDPAELEMSRSAALVTGVCVLLMGLGLLVASLLPLFLHPRPWLWTYDLVIICLGLRSACFLPACVPLLIHWMKPETKSYFGKKI